MVAVEPLAYNTEVVAASIGRGNFSDRLRLYKTAVASEPGDDMCVMPSEGVGANAKNNQGNGQLRPVAECQARGGKYKSSEIVPLKSIDAIVAGSGPSRSPHARTPPQIRVTVEWFNI